MKIFFNFSSVYGRYVATCPISEGSLAAIYLNIITQCYHLISAQRLPVLNGYERQAVYTASTQGASRDLLTSQAVRMELTAFPEESLGLSRSAGPSVPTGLLHRKPGGRVPPVKV